MQISKCWLDVTTIPSPLCPIPQHTHTECTRTGHFPRIFNPSIIGTQGRPSVEKYSYLRQKPVTRRAKKLTLKHPQKLWDEFKHPPLNERIYPQIGAVICCNFFIQLPSDAKIFLSAAWAPPHLFFPFFWICSLMHKHGKTLPPKSLVTARLFCSLHTNRGTCHEQQTWEYWMQELDR